MQKTLNRPIATGCLILVLKLFECARSEPRSTIVEKVERAGSGDLAAVSKDGIREWLGKHRDVAYQADEMCQPLRRNVPAQWAESTEGKLCIAAHELAFWRGGPVTGDHKTYSSVLK